MMSQPQFLPISSNQHQFAFLQQQQQGGQYIQYPGQIPTKIHIYIHTYIQSNQV